MHRAPKLSWARKLPYNFLHTLNTFWMRKVLLKLYIFCTIICHQEISGQKKDNILLSRTPLRSPFCKLNNTVAKALASATCNWIWWHAYRSRLIRKGKDYSWEWKSSAKCSKYETCSGFPVRLLCLSNRVFEMSDHFYSYAMISKELVPKRLECI